MGNLVKPILELLDRSLDSISESFSIHEFLSPCGESDMGMSFEGEECGGRIANHNTVLQDPFIVIPGKLLHDAFVPQRQTINM